MSWTTLCDISDLEENKGKYVEIGGFQLAVFLSCERVYVMDNYCPHAGGNLAGGIVEDGCAVCPWHFWPFRLETGELRDSPGVMVKTYPTRIIEHDRRKLRAGGFADALDDPGVAVLSFSPFKPIMAIREGIASRDTNQPDHPGA